MNLYKIIAEILSDALQTTVHIRSQAPVAGGSINKTLKIETNKGDFLVKINETLSGLPDFFEKEIHGLQLLRGTQTFIIPEVITSHQTPNCSFLILEYIEPDLQTSDFFYRFGASLAKLHAHTNRQFGLAQDNYIGTLPQSNTPHSNWFNFFISERIEKQLKLAVDSKKMKASIVTQFKNLYKLLDGMFPQEPPALLHGDLWSGNFLCTMDGNVCIFDPAVYYGNREVDIAMTKLFGGFDVEFYKGYTDEWPLQPGWQERVDICNLYPLLVHVNLFGGAYLSEIQQVLNKFKC